MNRINTISLHDVLPEVFVPSCDSDKIVDSELWLTDFDFERGHYYCVNAESGVGKTSLCNFIYGLRHDYAGRITFDGNNIADYGVDNWCELRCRHLAYLPQEVLLFPELTALDNVMLKNRLTSFRTEAEIRAMFEELEIDNRLNTPAGKMSLGQQQRVALIRSLCQPFDFLLLDEPVSHLDSHTNRLSSQMAVDAAAAQEAGIIGTSVGYGPDVEIPLIELTL